MWPNVFRLLLPAFALALILGLKRRRGIDHKLPDVKRPTSFKTVVDLIIKHLEGGYFHPDMISDGRLKTSSAEILEAYKKSGETLFGIDRKNFQVKDIRLDKFWSAIDKANLKKSLKWNGFPAEPLNAELRTFVYGFMKTNFDTLERLYLLPKAREIVSNYPPLFLQFVYASWNGAGFFKKFAKIVNENTDLHPSVLFDKIQDARLASVGVIKQGAPKIDQLATYLLYA